MRLGPRIPHSRLSHDFESKNMEEEMRKRCTLAEFLQGSM